MSRSKLTVLLLLCLPFCGMGQASYRARIDSLKIVFSKAGNDTSRISALANMLSLYDYYNAAEGLTYKDTAISLANKTGQERYIAKVNHKIGRLFWRIGKFDSAYGYHFRALELYKKGNDVRNRNEVLIEIGQDYLNDTKFAEAEKYLLEAVRECKATNDQHGLFFVYNILTALYGDQGKYIEESKAAYEGLKVTEATGDKKETAYALSAVASSAQNLGNTAEAIKNYDRCLQLTVETGDKLLESSTCTTMGDLYLSLSNFTVAEIYYKRGVQAAQQMENPGLVLAILHRGLANNYFARGFFRDALQYYQITAEELRSHASNHALANVYAEIGTVYTKLREFAIAGKYFDSSAALCRYLNTSVNFEAYYSGLQLLDSARGNWKDAYKHYRQYIGIRDSTFSKETLRKMLTTQMQYENEKKEGLVRTEQEKKDILAASALKRQRTIRNYALAVLGVLLLFSGIVFFQRNKLAREKKRSDQLLQDKELLLREIHHRVKNNLEVVSSLLALQGAQTNDLNTKEAILEGQNRVHSIGIVHQKLYQGDNLGAIEMKEYFMNLSESILDSFGAETRVKVALDMDQLDIDIDTAVPLGLIVNELLTNTLKYAFPGNRPGTVRIQLIKQPGGILHLEVADDGIGKSGVTHGTGFGSQLVALLTKQLNGTIHEKNEHGTCISFDFSLSA